MKRYSVEKHLYDMVGRRVRQLRDAAEYTQEELSARVGLSRTSIANLEAGRQKVRLFHLFLIAEALGKDLAALLPTRQEVVNAQPEVVSGIDQNKVSDSARELIDRLSKGEQHGDPTRR